MHRSQPKRGGYNYIVAWSLHYPQKGRRKNPFVLVLGAAAGHSSEDKARRLWSIGCNDKYGSFAFFHAVFMLYKFTALQKILNKSVVLIT